MKITIEFYIFELVFVLNFSFNNFNFLEQKKDTSSQNKQ